MDKDMEKSIELQESVQPAVKEIFLGDGKGTGVWTLPPVRNTGVTKVLLIREYTPCRFLTTFALGYLRHLHYELNRRPKLVFVYNKGYCVDLKYRDFTVIDKCSAVMDSLYDEEIVGTNYPNKQVIENLLNRKNDVVIIVDRLYGQSDIVTGRVVRVNAVSSHSDIDRYGVRPEETIFSVTGEPNQLFMIPLIKGFPMDIESRQALYAKTMQDNYELLDRKLNLM